MGAMQQAAHSVVHQTNEYPVGLKTAHEIAENNKGISAERVLELANAGYMPHYRIDNGNPLFKPAEVKQWIANNLMGKCAGRNLPDAIRVVVPAALPFDRPPIHIANVPALQQLPRHGYQPGVYFLCSGDEVVYVGQSTTPSSRIGTHSMDNKKQFDRVYLLPVPMSELNDVEAAFIHLLRPKLNGSHKGENAKPVAPAMSKSKEEILKSFGMEI